VLKKAWLLALLTLAACGGGAPTDSGTEQGAATDSPASAERDPLEPELVATNAADETNAPTTDRFKLGVQYLRLSPTQPTSSNPDQVEVCEVFWYGCPHCNALDTEAKIQEFFGRSGVDAAAFKTAWDSVAVNAKLQRADELNRRYRINSVPTLVVNGKYTTDGPMAGSYEALLALTDELVAAERESR